MREGAATAARRWFALFLFAYLLALFFLTRGITVDMWDGFKALNDIRLLSGDRVSQVPFDPQRPPAGWLPWLPVIASLYELCGPEATLRFCHALMLGYLGLLLWGSFRLYERRLPAGAAFTAAVLLAFNPLVVQSAPFFLMDIFSAAVFLLLVRCGESYALSPDRRNLLLLSGAYCLGFLSKFHLGLFIIVPLAYALWQRPRSLLTSALWLLPPLCVLVATFILGAMTALAIEHPLEGWRMAFGEIVTNFSFNVAQPRGYPWSAYFTSLWTQLGPGLSVLGLVGLGVWARRRRPEDVYGALSLAGMLLAMCVFVSNKEQRYLIPLLPLAYLAVAEGAEFFLSRGGLPESSRKVLRFGVLLLAPWGATAVSARYLEDDPSLRVRLPFSLARVIESQSPPPACVTWGVPEDFFFRPRGELLAKEQNPILGATTLQFYTRIPLRRPTTDPNASADACGWKVMPRAAVEWPLRQDQTLAELHSPDGKSVWEIRPEGLAPAGPAR